MSNKFFLEMSKHPHPFSTDEKLSLYFNMLNLAYDDDDVEDEEEAKAQYEFNAMKNWKVVKVYNLDCSLNSFWKLVKVTYERVGETHTALIAFREQSALGSWRMEFLQVVREDKRTNYPAYVNMTTLKTGMNKIDGEYKMCYEVNNLTSYWGFEMITQREVEDYLAIMKYVNNLKAKEVK